MASKKKADEIVEQLEGFGGVEGSTITRVKKAKKTAEKAAEIEEELHDCGAIAFTSEFIERLVLLFDLPCVVSFCKCALVWAYADVNNEMADLLAEKYVELCKRLAESEAKDDQ